MRANEKEAAFAPAVGRHLEMTGEVKGGIVRLPFVLERDRLVLPGNARNIVLVEGGVLEFRRLEFALCLANQVIDLGGENAIDLKLDHGHAARSDGEFAFAAESEQTAVALDFDFLNINKYRVIIGRPVR